MASTVTGPILHVALDAHCELTNVSGQGAPSKFDKFGLALSSGALCLAAGAGDKVSLHALGSISKVHAKFLESGKLTFELTAPRGGMRQLLVSKARAEDLRGVLGTLDHATKLARQRGLPVLPQDECVLLLQKRYPEQVNKQLAKLRQERAGNDGPAPSKGHTRVMLVLDAADSSGRALSPAQVGKELMTLATQDFGLTAHARLAESNAQSFACVAKDAAKVAQLAMRCRTCMHHRWSNAVWLDVDVGAGVDPTAFRVACVKRLALGDESRVSATSLPHGAIKEKLAMGLVVHLRSGTLGEGGGADFGTRLELRWSEQPADGAPLGVCDVRFWEEGTRTPAPTCVAFEMHKESCKAWSLLNGDKKVSVLAASLVSRLEVFCLRLAASSAGAAVRTKVLVAGWSAAVTTEPFVRRGFRFEGAPDGSLGFKMLKSEEAKAREAAAREEAAKLAAAAAAAKEAAAGGAAAEAVNVNAGEGHRVTASVALGLGGKRKRAAAPGGDVDSPQGTSGGTPVPLRTPGTTPGTGSSEGASSSGAVSGGAASSASSAEPRQRSGGGLLPEDSEEDSDDSPDDEEEDEEEEAAAEAGGRAAKRAQSAAQAAAQAAAAQAAAEEERQRRVADAEEWGEISSLGRFATQSTRTAEAPSGVPAGEESGGGGGGGSSLLPAGSAQLGEGDYLDDVDATMAALLG